MQKFVKFDHEEHNVISIVNCKYENSLGKMFLC